MPLRYTKLCVILCSLHESSHTEVLKQGTDLSSGGQN